MLDFWVLIYHTVYWMKSECKDSYHQDPNSWFDTPTYIHMTHKCNISASSNYPISNHTITFTYFQSFSWDDGTADYYIQPFCEFGAYGYWSIQREYSIILLWYVLLYYDGTMWLTHTHKFVINLLTVIWSCFPAVFANWFTECDLQCNCKLLLFAPTSLSLSLPVGFYCSIFTMLGHSYWILFSMWTKLSGSCCCDSCFIQCQLFEGTYARSLTKYSFSFPSIITGITHVQRSNCKLLFRSRRLLALFFYNCASIEKSLAWQSFMSLSILLHVVHSLFRLHLRPANQQWVIMSNL